MCHGHWTACSPPSLRVLLELWQVVGDLEPRRLGADEDVLCRPDAGSSTSEPIATCTYSPPRTTEKSNEPHAAQRVSLRSRRRRQELGAAGRDLSFPRSMPANALNADPVVRRHCERQWQLTAYSEGVLDLVAHRPALAHSAQSITPH